MRPPTDPKALALFEGSCLERYDHHRGRDDTDYRATLALVSRLALLGYTPNETNTILQHPDCCLRTYKTMTVQERVDFVRKARSSTARWAARNIKDLKKKFRPISEPGLYNAIWEAGYSTHCQHGCGKKISPGDEIVLAVESIWPTAAFHFCSMDCFLAEQNRILEIVDRQYHRPLTYADFIRRGIKEFLLELYAIMKDGRFDEIYPPEGEYRSANPDEIRTRNPSPPIVQQSGVLS